MPCIRMMLRQSQHIWGTIKHSNHSRPEFQHRMARVEAATLSLFDKKGLPDGLQRVVDFFHPGFRDGAAAAD